MNTQSPPRPSGTECAEKAAGRLDAAERAAAEIELGVLLANSGRYREACAILETVAGRTPECAEAQYHLGVCLQTLGRSAEAATAYDNALKANPHHPEALLGKGSLLHARGEIDAALAAYERAIAARPNFSAALANRALCLISLQRMDDALACVDRAIDADPANVDALMTRGTILTSFEPGGAQPPIDKIRAALDSYDRAIALAPNRSAIYHNRAMCLDRAGRLEDALADALTAVRLTPNLPQAHTDLAAYLSRLGRFEEALDASRKAAKLAPGDPRFGFDAGMAELLAGNFREGWRGYELRLDLPQFSFAYPRGRRWDGQPRPGRTILVRAEQGYGDTIQFMRLLPRLKSFGMRVIFECQPGFASLGEGCDGFDEIREWTPETTGDVEEGTVQISLLSLPYYMGIDLNTIPADIPYLRPDPALSQRWRERLWGEEKSPPASTAVNVGICWAGRPVHPNDSLRSVALAGFSPVADIEGVSLYSLQKGAAALQAADPPARMRLIDLSEAIESYADTAAIVENLDLVITVDTSVAHLAGALGKPVWTLIRAQPDWRWMRDRDDSPWYPTMRLFRQARYGEWEPVFEAVASELRRFAESPLNWLIADAERRHAARAAESTPVARSVRRTARLAMVELLRRFPDSARACNALGTLSWTDGDVQTAVNAFARAGALDPDDPAIAANRADVLTALGRLDAAMALCREYLGSHPGDPEIESILRRGEASGAAKAA